MRASVALLPPSPAALPEVWWCVLGLCSLDTIICSTRVFRGRHTDSAMLATLELVSAFTSATNTSKGMTLVTSLAAAVTYHPHLPVTYHPTAPSLLTYHLTSPFLLTYHLTAPSLLTYPLTTLPYSTINLQHLPYSPITLQPPPYSLSPYSPLPTHLLPCSPPTAPPSPPSPPPEPGVATLTCPPRNVWGSAPPTL